MKRFAPMILALALCATATAATRLGNPTTEVRLETGPDIYMYGVRTTICGETWQDTHLIQESWEAGDNATISLTDGEDYCGMEVRVKWTQNGPYYIVPVSDVETTEIDAANPVLTISIDSAAKTATLVE